MRHWIRHAVAAASLATLASTAWSTVLTFDDLAGDGAVPAAYGGLDWSASSWFAFGGEQAPFTAHSGSFRAALGWDGSEAGSLVRFNAPATFAGAYFAGFEGVNVSFKLYLGDQLVGTSATLALGEAPAFLASGYSGLIDRLVLASNDHANLVMDDFSFTAAVPEPGSVALALGGLIVTGVIARRTRGSMATRRTA